MANSIQVDVDFKSLVMRLQALPVELGSKRGGPLRVALRAAGRVVQAQAKKNAENLPPAVAVGGSLNPKPSQPSADSIVDTSPQIGRTGNLARAIRLSLVRNPQGATEALQLWVYPGKRGAYYWRYVEFGTSLMAARPFMRPAFESTKGQALQTFTDTMARALAAAERKLARM